MESVKQSDLIFIDETERKPNLYASRILNGIVAVIAVVWLVNEVGIFEVDKLLMRICLVLALLQFVAMRLIASNPKMLVRSGVKFAFMGMTLFLVLTAAVLLNIHAVLVYVLPLLLATQYRSYVMSRIAIIGSCTASIVAPILSYFFGTWNLTFMTGYIQTFCRVTIDIVPGNGIGAFDAIWQIVLYWALPQMLLLAAFGYILFSVTKSGIDSVGNQMRVSDLSADLAQQLNSITTMQEKVLFSMSDIIESRDTDTGGHVRRTSEIVRLIMRAMQSDPCCEASDAFCAAVIKCAPMHDLGKIAVPDTILKKTDGLTNEEYNVIKQHPLKSAQIIERALTDIEDAQLVATAVNIAKYHHEKVDGTGYPEGLRGDDIPLEARIMAIADVYDALVSKRCYKERILFERAFEIIEEGMGTQFDSSLNRYFIACRKDIEDFYTASEQAETDG